MENYAYIAAIGLVAAGVLLYSAYIALALLPLGWRWAEQSRAWINAAPAQNIGIPAAAAAAFAIVSILLKVFPPAANDGGSVSIKLFGLEFSGPSGPITLWAMCFLAFVFALKILRHDGATP